LLCVLVAAGALIFYLGVHSDNDTVADDNSGVNHISDSDSDVPWVRLDRLQTYNDGFRQHFDEIFNINVVTEDGIPNKSGCLYISLDDTPLGNSTLYHAFSNGIFRNTYWGTDKAATVRTIADEAYTDIDDESPYALYASFNAYYNLLYDSENPNLFNPTQTVSREEFYTAVYKAYNSVHDIDMNSVAQKAAEFGFDSVNGYTKFVIEYSNTASYLTAATGSLTSEKLSEPITRGEAVYTLMYLRFGGDDGMAKAYAELYHSNSSLRDANNASYLEASADVAGSEAALLAEILANPKRIVPEDMYMALYLARDNWVVSPETRWYENITRAETVDMLIKTLQTEPIQSNKREDFIKSDISGEALVEGIPLSLYQIFVEARDYGLNHNEHSIWDFSEFTLDDFREYFGNHEYIRMKSTVSQHKQLLMDNFYTFSYMRLESLYSKLIDDFMYELTDDLKEQYNKWWLASDKYGLWIASMKHLGTLLSELYDEENASKIVVDVLQNNTTEQTPPSQTTPKPTTPTQGNNTKPQQQVDQYKPQIDANATGIVGYTPSGKGYGSYADDIGYNAKQDAFIGPMGNVICSPNKHPDDYNIQIAMSVLAPSGSLANDSVFTSYDRINSDMANLKNVLTADAYAKLEEQVAFAKTINWVDKNRDALGVFALPDGTYVPCAGTPNTRLWTDPNASWRYIEYDDKGCMRVVVDWPDDGPYAGAIAYDQIVNNGSVPYLSPEKLQKQYEDGGCLEAGRSYGWEEAFVDAYGF